MYRVRQTVYEAAGGTAAFVRVADAWHERCLADPIVSHAFEHGIHPQHTERLAAYWAEALGGPARYTGELGEHSEVLMIHSGHGEHEEMDRRAADCFALALDDAELPTDPELRATLTAWFAWMVARMADYPRSSEDVPAGLRLPVWSWDGPVID